MSFKGGVRRHPSSLSYKLKRILRFKAREVLCTRPYVTVDADLVPLDDVVARADLLIIGAPHHDLRATSRSTVPIVDIWNLRGRGPRVTTLARSRS